MAYVAPSTVSALSTLSAATWNQDVVANVIDINSRLPTGALQMYAGATAPSNWLLCDGTETLISGYAALYAVCSTTYGDLTNGSAAPGTTHFRLPDLRGRVPIGAGAGAGLTVRALGAYLGTETVTLSSGEIPAHTHPYTLAYSGTGTAGGNTGIPGTGSAPDASFPTNTGSNTGGGGAHNNIQPVLALSYIIKT